MELDGYILYEAIAFGSSGPLWRAVDTQGRNFALQMLPGPPDADLQQRLGVLTSLRHPNLLTCHQTRVTTDGRHVVLFDYLQGVDLEVYRAASRLGPPQLHHLAFSLASALEALHSRDLAHGDISAANVMLTDHCQVVLVDVLGLHPGFTPPFAAPERAHSGPTPPSDIYALGAVLLQLGMERGNVSALLDPDPANRPSASQLVQQWGQLPMYVIPALSDTQLDLGRMRAAGRDIATVYESPAKSGAGGAPGSRSRGPGRISATCLHRAKSRRSLSPAAARSSDQVAHRLRLGISALAGIAAVLGVALAHPDIGNWWSGQQSAVAAKPQAVSSPTPPASSRDSDSTSSGPSRDSSPTPPAPSRDSDPTPMVSLPKDRAQTDISGLGPHTARAVVQELLDLRSQALITGDQAELARVSVADSFLSHSDARLQQRLKSSGAKLEKLRCSVKEVEILDSTPKRTRLRVALSQEAYIVRDSLGNPHQIAALPPHNFEVLLEAKPWRLAGVVRLGEN